MRTIRLHRPRTGQSLVFSRDEYFERGKLGPECRYTPLTFALQPLDGFLTMRNGPSDVLLDESGTLLKVAMNTAHGLPLHCRVCDFGNRSSLLCRSQGMVLQPRP